jgi:hypothetical protein
MSRPTREQIEAARTWLGHAVDGCSIGGRNEEMIRILLAATAEPTDPVDGTPCGMVRPGDGSVCELSRGHAGYHQQTVVDGLKQWLYPPGWGADSTPVGARREGAR